MAKNILLFFDGTSNKFGENMTNVVKTYAIANKSDQLACYIPGVGSIADKMEYSRVSRTVKKGLGLGFGFGLQEKIVVGYRYLMEHYRPGDKIYVFGFSRGAYTAKVLAGLLFACGLMEKGNEYHIQYAYELYTKPDYRFDLAAKFKKMFATFTPEVHFMGLWDSVSSVGNVRRMRNFPYTTNVRGVKTIRHALAIDEKRALFKQNSTKSNGDCQEVWFAGVHGDVGGGNPEMESALAKVPLKWMIDEAEQAGMVIDRPLYERFILNTGNDPDITTMDPLGKQHKNNFLTWGLLELFPRYKIIDYEPKKKTKWYWPLFGRRKIPAGSLVHQSVADRINDPDLKYRASNLPKEYGVVQ